MQARRQCTCCGKIYETDLKFCPDCGHALSEEIKGQSISVQPENPARGAYNMPLNPTPEAKPGPSDEGLILLVDCCKKKVATVGGDGYTETVLYKDPKTGEYSIHTYSQYQPDNVLHHRGYKTTEEFKDRVFEFIEKSGIKEFI